MATRQTPGTRAKDSNRNNTCQILDSALSEVSCRWPSTASGSRMATTAMTLGQLQALVSDLQTNNAPVHLPHLSKPRLGPRLARGLPPGGAGLGLRLAVAGVLVVLGIAIGWGLYGNTASPLSFTSDTSDPGAKSNGITPVVLTPPKQLHSLGGLTGLMEQMKQRFGDT